MYHTEAGRRAEWYVQRCEEYCGTRMPPLRFLPCLNWLRTQPSSPASDQFRVVGVLRQPCYELRTSLHDRQNPARRVCPENGQSFSVERSSENAISMTSTRPGRSTFTDWCLAPDGKEQESLAEDNILRQHQVLARCQDNLASPAQPSPH